MIDFCFIANSQMSQSVACADNKMMLASIASWAYSRNKQSKAASKADGAARTVGDKAACHASNSVPCLPAAIVCPLLAGPQRGWVSCSHPHSMFTNRHLRGLWETRTVCKIAMKGKVYPGKFLVSA